MTFFEQSFTSQTLHQDGSVVLAFFGELDMATADLCIRAVEEITGPSVRAVTVDLGHLDFVDVLGLRALLRAQELVQDADAEFRLRSVGTNALRALRAVQFTQLLEAVEETDVPTARNPGSA